LDQRRTQRYRLELPLEIVQLGGRRVSRREITRDISSAGISFHSPIAVDVGARVEYLITLSRKNPPVRIRCLGKVLRSLRTASAGAFEVAVTMERYQFLRESELESLAIA
jgi:hypothetical protein